MQNSPNLKAVRFKGARIKISNDFIFEIFETKGIIISIKDSPKEIIKWKDISTRPKKISRFLKNTRK